MLKLAEYAKNEVSPSSHDIAAKATPRKRTHCVSARATNESPNATDEQAPNTRILMTKGRNGIVNFIAIDGIVMASKIAPVDIKLQYRPLSI